MQNVNHTHGEAKQHTEKEKQETFTRRSLQKQKSETKNKKANIEPWIWETHWNLKLNILRGQNGCNFHPTYPTAGVWGCWVVETFSNEASGDVSSPDPFCIMDLNIPMRRRVNHWKSSAAKTLTLQRNKLNDCSMQKTGLIVLIFINLVHKCRLISNMLVMQYHEYPGHAMINGLKHLQFRHEATTP